MNTKKILISILNWNKAQETLDCVASLIENMAAAAAEVTVLVIDNGSKKSDLEILKSGMQQTIGQLKQLPKNLGFSGGHNIAIETAIAEGYDYIWLMNNDATVRPGTLSQLLEAMEIDPKCGAASPVVRSEGNESLIEFCVSTFDWHSRGSTDAESIEQAEVIQAEHPASVWLLGAAVFFRVKALKDVGALDDRFFAYYEDCDIGARLSAAGWYSKCVFHASVIHDTKTDPAKRPLYFFYLMQRNEMLFWHKNTPPMFRRLLWLKLIDTALYKVNRLYRKGYRAEGDAAILGMYDFLLQRFGAPVLERKVPMLLRLACWTFASRYTKKIDASDFLTAAKA